MHASIRPVKCIVALHWLMKKSESYQNEVISIRENWNLAEQQSWYGLTEDLQLESTNPSEDDNESAVTNDDWTEDKNFKSRLTGKTDSMLHPGDVRSSQKTTPLG